MEVEFESGCPAALSPRFSFPPGPLQVQAWTGFWWGCLWPPEASGPAALDLCWLCTLPGVLSPGCFCAHIPRPPTLTPTSSFWWRAGPSAPLCLLMPGSTGSISPTFLLPSPSQTFDCLLKKYSFITVILLGGCIV